jgi:hypothetical protein
MPEESEVPTEHLHESLEEHARESREKWISQVALSAAILAVLAAIASMLAGHHANEALIVQLKASDQWGYYQSKGIKAGVLNSKVDLFSALGKAANPEDGKKLEEYKQEQTEIKEKADELEKEAAAHLKVHTTQSRAVTCFQIGIALSAIAVLTRRKILWFGSMLLGMAGVVFLIVSSLA